MDVDEFKISFGNNLKTLRKEKKFSQEMISELIGIEIHNYSRIETGKSFPRVETLVKILNVLNAEPSELFCHAKSYPESTLRGSINKILDSAPEKTRDFYKILIALCD